MIDVAEIKVYRSAVINDGSTNGGRLSNVEVVSGALANLFPVTTQTERTAGALKYRKAYHAVKNALNSPLYNPRIIMDYPTPGNDIITFFPGTQIDTQASITGTENQYGVGNLNANVSAGATAVTVLVEAAATIIFRNGEEIRISDMAAVDAGSGNEEFVLISGVPTLVGNVVTVNLAAPLVNGYSAANTRVASVYKPTSPVQAAVDTFSVSTVGSGDYNPGSLTPDGKGSIEQTWTLTWTNATTFNIVGDTLGSLGTGTIGAGAAPANAGMSAPYFTLLAAGFSGVWAAGDTLTFKTHPAAVPVWYKRNVPALSAANASNSAITGLIGETA
jgi:hypothetical protein